MRNSFQAGFPSRTSNNVTFAKMRQSYGSIRSLARDDHGNPLYAIGVVIDITHRKAVQEMLRKSEASLQQQNIDLERRVLEGDADLIVANLALVAGQKNLELLSQRLIDAQDSER